MEVSYRLNLIVDWNNRVSEYPVMFEHNSRKGLSMKSCVSSITNLRRIVEYKTDRNSNNGEWNTTDEGYGY
jgi:hypothetical protein